jgi:hypothetical protein
MIRGGPIGGFPTEQPRRSTLINVKLGMMGAGCSQTRRFAIGADRRVPKQANRANLNPRSGDGWAMIPRSVETEGAPRVDHGTQAHGASAQNEDGERCLYRNLEQALWLWTPVPGLNTELGFLKLRTVIWLRLAA